MSNEDIDANMKMLQDIILIRNSIYSLCHKPCVTTTDADIGSVGKTVEIFSELWRDDLSVTVEAHMI